LDGARRSLLDITQFAAKSSGFQFIDANNVVLRTDTVVSTAALGGSPKRLAAIPAGTRANFSAVSHDGRTFAGLMSDQNRSDYNQIEILSLDNGQRRVFEVPFHFAGQTQPKFSRDDRTLLVVGQRAGDTTSAHIYAVPIDGGAPRELASVGRPSGAAVSVSPDGKSIVYSVQDVRTTSLLLVDLRPAMRGGTVQTGGARKP
jgi:Tol biopolymer transport system component